MVVCEKCGKNKRKLPYVDKNDNKKTCTKCAIKFIYNRDKSIFKVLKFIFHMLKHKVLDFLDSKASLIVMVLLVSYLSVCLYHNLKNFDLLNLSMVAFLCILLKSEW